MPSHADLYVRTLHRAAEQVGGPDALAKRLGVAAELLSLYLEGRYAIPERVFLDAIDVLMEREALRLASGQGSARPAGNR